MRHTAIVYRTTPEHRRALLLIAASIALSGEAAAAGFSFITRSRGEATEIAMTPTLVGVILVLALGVLGHHLR
jgi:hypothetical protein